MYLFSLFYSLNVKKVETEFQTHKYISNSYTTKTWYLNYNPNIGIDI